MPAVPTTYTYQRGNDIIQDLTPDTSLVASAASASLVDQINFTFPDVLPVDDKGTLDDYMTAREYEFMGQLP